MTRDTLDRRAVLRTSGSALAALTGVSLVGNATADVDADYVKPCCDDGGGGGGGGGGSGSPPSVTTRYATVDGDRATMDGAVDSTGSSDSASAWIEWGPEGDGLPYDTRLEVLDGPGWYSGQTFDGLSSGTYEYRAAGSNDWGKVEGYTRTFSV